TTASARCRVLLLEVSERDWYSMIRSEENYDKTFFRVFKGKVSQAVRNTRRGALLRMVMRYSTVRFASALAVSRSSHPNPFCTTSSPSFRRKLDKRMISEKKHFLARTLD